MDRKTVQLKGLKTGEIVTLKLNDKGDRSYSSSNPNHPAFEYQEEPTSCPQEDQPAWYTSEFLNPNTKPGMGLVKMGINNGNFRNATGFRGFPLKFRGFFLN